GCRRCPPRTPGLKRCIMPEEPGRAKGDLMCPQEEDGLVELLAGAVPVLHLADGTLQNPSDPPGLLLPGSFNPLHPGHLELAALRLGRPAAFELSVVNADKPPLSESEVRRRLRQFARQAPVWLTRAPTFLEKARLFGGAVFVVGADTAVRIVQPRFYGDSVEA